MRIVAATAGDAEAVLHMEREAAEAPHWTEAEYRAIVEPQAGPVRRCLLVCWIESDVAGFAVGKAVAGEAELESVVVRAAARRAGVGRALCEAVLVWAWEQGAAAVDLELRASSVGARALYDGLGFVEVGRRPRYYAEPTDDAVLMRRTMPPSEHERLR